MRTKHSVYMISQKDCLDVGDARGAPIRSVYNHFDFQTPPSNVIGDFDFTRPSNEDAYMECVKNKTQWNALLPWFPNKTLPVGMTQMVRQVVGGHTGGGLKLTPFDFNYSKDELNEVFRQLVKDAVDDKKVSEFDEPRIISGRPITMSTYPFETGHSIIGPPTDELVQLFYRDNSNLGWHRALQAKSALSNRQDPPPPLPSELKTGELVSLIVLTFVAIFLFERALKEAVRIRSTAIQDWDNPTGPLALLDEKEDVGDLDRFRAFFTPLFNPNNQSIFSALLDRLFLSQTQGILRASRAGTIDILLAFVTAIASMVAAILEFTESAYRYMKVFIANSGGVITYGPSRPELSKQPENIWAGAEFSVNHWLALNISDIGYKWLQPLVFTVCALLILYMLYLFYIYSLRREHDLDFELIRYVFRPVKRAILFPQNILGKFLLKSVERRNNPDNMVLLSYESVFQTVFNKLAVRYEYQPLSPDEMPELWVAPSGFQRYKINDFSSDLVQGPVQDLESSFVFRNKDITVSRDAIAKCAEILAADRFGMLGRAQALTLMYSRTAAKAADRFLNDNQLPDTNEIQLLALIFYVRNVVIPDGRGDPVIVRPGESQFINVGAHLRGMSGQTENSDHSLASDYTRTICAVIGRRPRAGDAVLVSETSNCQVIDDANPETIAVRDEEWSSDNVMYLAV